MPDPPYYFHAKEWSIDPDKIGMIGSSAGSHLILNMATHADDGNPDSDDPIERESCRPNFMALLCPWPNRQTVEEFPIDQNTPPTFIASAKDDKIAPISFAREIAKSCEEAGVSVMLWEIESGGHTAFKQARNPAYQWMEYVQAWLKKKNLWKDLP